MSIAAATVLPLCRKCKRHLRYRCTETVELAGASEEVDVFECDGCGRLAAFVGETVRRAS